MSEQVATWLHPSSSALTPSVTLRETPQTPVPAIHENSSILIVPSDKSISASKLKNFLNSSSEGRVLLMSYQEKGILDSFGRKRLSQLIISNEFNGDPNKKITSCRLQELADQISETFEGENSDTYFVPYTKLSATEKRAAKGKLHDCMNNKRRELKRLLGESLQSNDTVEIPLENTLLTDSNEGAFEEDLAWLRKSRNPWHTLQTKWANTTSIRTKQLQQREKSVADYMKEFPALQLPHGYLLVSRTILDQLV